MCVRRPILTLPPSRRHSPLIASQLVPLLHRAPALGGIDVRVLSSGLARRLRGRRVLFQILVTQHLQRTVVRGVQMDLGRRVGTQLLDRAGEVVRGQADFLARRGPLVRRVVAIFGLEKAVGDGGGDGVVLGIVGAAATVAVLIVALTLSEEGEKTAGNCGLIAN